MKDARHETADLIVQADTKDILTVFALFSSFFFVFVSNESISNEETKGTLHTITSLFTL